ncbi:hypothetical protein MMC28_007899 [Mycoblastus sanguinarius]|nr:hypothetical protein [Mycoblastus sanguinarius]
MPSNLFEEIDAYYESKQTYEAEIKKAWARTPSNTESTHNHNSTTETDSMGRSGQGISLMDPQHELNLELEKISEKLEAAKVKDSEEGKSATKK